MAISLVFGAPELLTQILSYVGIRDLLTSALRVNSFWNQVIATTPYFQEALFFRLPKSHTPLILNPLIKHAWPQWFQPLSSFNHNNCQPRACDFRNLEWARRPLAFQRQEASWRKMLIASGNPAITSLRVYFRPWARIEHRYTTLTFPDGIRMGTLWDVTKDWCKLSQIACFAINWPEEFPFDLTQNSMPVYEIDQLFQEKKLSTPLITKRDGDLTKERMSIDGDGILELIMSNFTPKQSPPWLGPEFQSDAYEEIRFS